MTAAISLQTEAWAASPAVDSFSAGAKSQMSAISFASATQGAFPSNSNGGSLAVKWFEKFDETIFNYKVSEAELVILSRPINRELERVQAWIATADNVAKRYRKLATVLRALTASSYLPEIGKFRDLTADWYDDVALVYEDMITPRRPARTQEELQAALNDIKVRSQSLEQTKNNLKNMEMSLRKTYRVHLPRYDDALQQYVRSK